ncbi:MAG: DUF4292 domain-containing protein [Muribaculaceae bacterium]
MTRKNIFLILSVILLFTTACKASKQSNVTDTTSYSSENQRYSAVVNSYKNWNSIISPGKVSISIGKSMSSSMQLRMIKGKSISVSIRPLLGIEMARLHLTSDSIYFVDKYHKMYLAENISFFTQGIPLDITLLQDAFINRAFIIGEGELTHKMHDLVTIKEDGEQSWSIAPKNQLAGFIYSFILDMNNNLTEFNVMPNGGTAPYMIKYSDFKGSQIGTIAESVLIEASHNNQSYSLRLSIDPSRMSFNESFDDKFEVNSTYRRIPASSLSSILKNL